MSKYLTINTERATAAMQEGNMELASKIFEICYLIAQAIAKGETEETARGKYLIAIADLIANGEQI